MVRRGRAVPSAPVRPRTPQDMFDRVAPYYDRFNSLLSLGFDRRWRRRCARSVHLPPDARVLDLATGTGSLAMAVAAKAPAGSKIVGCDVNARMLGVGRRRVRRATRPVRLVRGGAESLPFADASMDAVLVGFAVDDFADRAGAVREMRRVLKEGGQVALLELSLPDQPLLRRGYTAGLKIMGLVARLPGRSGYGHLREEITGYRGAAATRRLLEEGGFGRYRCERLTFGVVTLHLARRT